MARRLLKPHDTAWLFTDSHRTPMQVGMLATFRVPADRPTFVADLVARWRENRTFAPPFSYLYRSLPVPTWSELEPDDIDLDYHLRHSALPAPGSQRELGVLVSRLHSAKLDRRYPLWECHVIEGLEEDRWALYMKAHHSQVDGVGGIRLLRRSLSVDPDARDMLPPWAIGTRGPDQSGVPRESRAAGTATTNATTTALETTAHPAGPVERLAASVGAGVGAGVEVAGSLARTWGQSLTGIGVEPGRAVPYRAPQTMFNGRIHTPRRFATQHYETDRLRRLARSAGVSLNDVFLGLCGGALRRYLTEQQALPATDLVANVPVSVRAGTEPGVGNAITFLYARLGTDIPDPVERLHAIRASTRRGSERLPQVYQPALDDYTAALMLPFVGQSVLGLGGRTRPAWNLVISNVPGPSETRYLDGSPMEELFPVSLLFNGQALNITGVSYDQGFNIGYTGCRDSIPSLQRIAVYSGEELERLEQAVQSG